MSSNRSTGQEYVTDVAYVRGFEKNLSPTRLRLCAALNGFEPPAADTFDYCELGCAQGDTTVALAAAFPQSRFLGVDLSATHVATAKTLARGGATDNVRFVERDFDDLLEDDLPAFDYIAAHGVLSWISPQKRASVIELLSARLKPGGLAYVSYNALPGWSAIEPLRQLILARAKLAPGNSLERARVGLEFASALSEAGAHYFEHNAAAKAMLETMKSAGLQYVVHEYLNAHWVPMYFAQVAAEMAARDLYFVGQLPPYLNYRDLSIAPSLEPMFSNVGDRVAFEGLKDFAVNTYFRSDVFIKGRASRSDAVTATYLEQTPFGTLGDEGPFVGEAKLPNHTLRYKGPVFEAIMPALAQGAATVPALHARFAQFERGRLRDAILHLVLGERISPLQTSTQTPTRAKTDALRVPTAYNRFILDRGFTTDVPVVLAAPSIGNGVQLSMVDAAGLFLALEPDAAKRKDWVRTFCADSLTHLVVGDRTVEDKSELEAIVLAEAERFREQKLPKMLELGIVAAS